MLTLRNTNIVFGLLLVIFVIIHFSSGMPVTAYVLLLFIYSLVLFYGSYFIQAGFYIKSICSSVTDKKEIAISFDDGPATNYTPEILQILKDQHVHAAFFCIGNRIAGNEHILQQVHEQGHIIGNHSFSHHFWFDLFPSKKMLNDIQLMNNIVYQLTGLTPRLFRPPYGVTNPNLTKAIKKGNYISVGWSVRSMDTVIKDEKKLMQKITRALKPGAIFLFHDTSKTTFRVLPDFIKQVKAEGYEIVRLDKMLKLNPYV